MAITITPNLIAGSGFTLDQNGARDVFGYLVEGLTPGDGIRVNAYNALPYHYGDAHPTDPSLFATQFSITPFTKSRTAVQAVVTFLPPDFSNLKSPLIRFAGATRMTRTNFDHAGEKIVVKYTPLGGEEIRVVGQVPAPRAYGILTIDRIENDLPAAALTYMNKLNSGTWQGQPKWTWWCKLVTFEKELYRPGYRVHYEFEYDELTFIQTAAYRDISGFIPWDVDDNTDRTILTPQNGYTNARINGEADFADLDLPAVFA